MANAKERKIFGVYIPSVLTKKVSLSINHVGKNLKQNLEKAIQKNTEGRCIPEGFVQPGSVKVLTYSSGNVNNENIEFQTVYECMVCHPVEGMTIECTAKTITKAGIHAEVIDNSGTVPVTVFIARDHHFTDKRFARVVEGDALNAIIIGCKFELNDPYISAIASLKS
jgi:DNA-directed RNA polymerase subunit E'/Rpb7